jgi:uncharacterized membrane protein
MFLTKPYKEILISTVVLLILDAMFISINMKAYSDQVVNIQRVVMKVKPLGAILSYLFIIGGLYFFIIRRNRPVWEAFVFGLVMYGVYDATNYALLKKWDPYLAIMDSIWGGVLMATTTYITYYFMLYKHLT